MQIRGTRWEEVRSDEVKVRSEEGAFGFYARCRKQGGEAGDVCRCLLDQDWDDDVWFVVECFDDALVGVLDAG